MQPSTYIKTMFGLGFAGFLFSGYLSGVKLLTASCAFNEPCPYFLGYPACWYGFGMFTIMFLAAIFGLLKILSGKAVAGIATFVSVIGILFAGYFTIPEINRLFLEGASAYSLGLPTCAYGLIFYILIFVLSLSFLRGSRNPN